MTKQAVTTAPFMLCAYCQIAHGLKRNAEKLWSAISPLGSTACPTGCCIQASVATMKYPESHDPRKTRKAANQWPRGVRRFSPKRKRPRNEDSRKNEKTPSIASVWPITPPAALANSDQFVPNWNSMGMPVTTPMAKLMPKIFAQKRAAASKRGSRVLSAHDFKITRRSESPIVSCGKR
jgi:hypothetical protein